MSQLDPIASTQFISLLVRINKELGTTVIVAEHQLGGLLSVAKRAVMLDNGKVCHDGDASSLTEHLSENNHPMLFEMPAGVRASASVSNVLPLLDVPSAKNWYTSYGEKHTLVSPAAADDKLYIRKKSVFRL